MAAAALASSHNSSSRGASHRGKKKNPKRQEPAAPLLESVLAALRRSISGCKMEKDDVVAGAASAMEIGWPTDVRHLVHVTFDRSHGFLGLPADLDPSSVFGVSPETMKCGVDGRGNAVPAILLQMQERLYAEGGLTAEGIFRINPGDEQEAELRRMLDAGEDLPGGADVHCLASLIKAWFRELPEGVLDGISPAELLRCGSEEEFVEIAGRLSPSAAALLDWAVELMADVVEMEEENKMNARNIAMVFAPNLTKMSDPLTALMHAVQVMNLLKALILSSLRERHEAAAMSSGDDDDRSEISTLTDDGEEENGEESYCWSEEDETGSDSGDGAAASTTTGMEIVVYCPQRWQGEH